MKWILGTAQFGLDYGISHFNGKMPIEAAHALLNTAWKANITTLDTAYNYGDAESRIGLFHHTHRNSFQIISKTQHFTESQTITAEHSRTLTQQLDQSLAQLSIPAFSAVLSHHIHDLQKPGGLTLWSALKDHPNIQKIGVSVYTGDDIDWVLQYLDPDIIQLPFNILDQRLLHSGHLEQLKSRRIETHARSVLLQGLLVMPLEQIKIKHPNAASTVAHFLQFCHDQHLPPLTAALRFVLQQPLIDAVIVGAQSPQELTQLIDSSSPSNQPPLLHSLASHLNCNQADIVDPRTWH